VEVDQPGPGEALVKIVASGVCHTDAIARDGDMPFPPPGVLGHEGAGIVSAVGAGVTNVAAGDKVVIGWPWCGTCRNFLDGQPRYCLQLGPLVLSGGRRRDHVTAAARRFAAAQPLHPDQAEPAGPFPYDKLVKTFPLDQVNDAFEASHSGDVIKPVLLMSE
jgi:Zn-dependent alcohol dehydrogenase